MNTLKERSAATLVKTHNFMHPDHLIQKMRVEELNFLWIAQPFGFLNRNSGSTSYKGNNWWWFSSSRYSWSWSYTWAFGDENEQKVAFQIFIGQIALEISTCNLLTFLELSWNNVWKDSSRDHRDDDSDSEWFPCRNFYFYFFYYCWLLVLDTKNCSNLWIQRFSWFPDGLLINKSAATWFFHWRSR